VTAQAAWLLSALLLGHCLGDFSPLSTNRMLEAKLNGGPLLPIAAHAAVHSLLVAIAVILLATPAWALVAAAAAIEFASHLGLDATRARLGLRYPVLRDSTTRSFWLALGADQLAHGLVLIAVAFLVL
jgi:hypothetical protein